jgi:hypothetical protein
LPNQPSSAAPPPQVEELLQSIIQLLQTFVPRASNQALSRMRCL